MYNDEFEVIVVGAGAGGIGAGVVLEGKKVPYVILEARDRIGGRVKSEMIDGVEVDIGAGWLHNYSKNNPMYSEVQRLKWKERKFERKEEEVAFDGETGHMYDEDDDQVAEKETENFIKAVMKTAKKNPQDLSIQQAGSQYFSQRINKLSPHHQRLIQLYLHQVENLDNAPLRELSAHNEEEDSDGEDFLPQQSYFAFLSAIAKDLNIRLNTKVTEINYTSDTPEVICQNGLVFKAKKIICAVPLGILKQKAINFVPALPEKHQKAIDSLGYGLMNKIILSLDQPLWADFEWIGIAQNQRGKFPYFYNLSQKGKNIIVCFVVGDFAKKISSWTDEEIINDLLEIIGKVEGKKVSIREYLITKWDKDPYSLGSYSFLKVGSTMEDTKNIKKSIDEKLWIVGEHCYGQYLGCVFGAFGTGKKAAQKVLK